MIPHRSALAVYALCAIAALLLTMRLVSAASVAMDDLRYGRPRLSVVTFDPNPADADTRQTVILALNADRQVGLIELPGGDVGQARTLRGPYLVGKGEDLTPVRVRLADANGDDVPDLILAIKEEHIIYINDGGAWRLINDAERAAYASGQAGNAMNAAEGQKIP